MSEQVFQYKGVPNSKGGVITTKEIMDMSLPEFLVFKDRLMNVRRRKRRDIAIYKNDVKVTTQHAKEIFRRGLGEMDTFANTNDEYVKTKGQTNMARGGHFGEGNVTIVYGIEAWFNQTALQATTTQNGLVTNPKGVAVANFDLFLLASAWCSQTELAFMRNERVIAEGLVEEFPQKAGLSGVAGASVGGIVQNAYMPVEMLASPEVFIDDEDFSVKVSPLAPEFDLTAASGLNVGIIQEVKLSTIELIRN